MFRSQKSFFNMSDHMINKENSDLILLPSSDLDSPSTTNSNRKQGLNIEFNQANIITRLLKNNNKEYIVIKNTKNVSSDSWSKFGFLAKKMTNILINLILY